MNARERIRKIFNFETPDRVGIDDHWWMDTIERWHGEGLPSNMHPEDYFNDMDFRFFEFDDSFMFDEQVIEESSDYRIIRNKWGTVQKRWKHKMGVPYEIDALIKTKKDWEKYKHLLVPDEKRMFVLSSKFIKSSSEEKARYTRSKRNKKFLMLAIKEPYIATWRKHGMVRTFINMIEQPNLIKDMFETHTNLVIGMVELMLDEGFDFDGIMVWDDIGYKGGTLFSPKTYKNLLFPFHKELCDFFKNLGFSTIIYDSDGDIDAFIPYLLDAGFNGLYPLESKAGMDVRKLKRQYADKLVLYGNIDVRVMGESKRKIEDEIKSKILIAKEGGGYIYHSDHSVPPTVSLENYEYMLDLVKKYGTY